MKLEQDYDVFWLGDGVVNLAKYSDYNNEPIPDGAIYIRKQDGKQFTMVDGQWLLTYIPRSST